MKERLPYSHIMARLVGTPLVLQPAKASIILEVMLERLRAQTPDLVLFDEDDSAVTLGRKRHVERDGYELIDGIAVVPVTGTLVHKLGQARPYSGMLGYDSIRLNFETALQDDEAEGILLSIDSPGGEVPGCFDLCDTLYGARGVKPVWATIDEQSCSAGYAIASCADRIVIPRTGLAGSIGVVCLHLDISAALADRGIKPTFVQFGAQKTDGASELPLSAEAQERLQKNVDAVGELFVSTVARNRSLDAKAVRAQEAGVFQGREAVDAGLVDAVMAADECFSEFHDFLQKE